MEENVKLILPFPHFLWMIGTKAEIFKENTAAHEMLTKQENISQTDIEAISRNGINANDSQ